MHILKSNSSHAFLLESIEDKKYGADILFQGMTQYQRTFSKKGTFLKKDNENYRYDNPKSAIKYVLEEYKSMPVENTPPFTGGLVGYFAYEYIGYTEEKLKFNTNDDFRDVDLMLFDSVIAFDNFKQKI